MTATEPQGDVSAEPLQRGYPRPQMTRPQWQPLNGTWEFVKDKDALISRPTDVDWSQCIPITVPFAPETKLSGVRDTSFYSACWYRRRFQIAPRTEAQRVFIRFGAVDYHATVWVNGMFAGIHQGGYTPFSFDVTDFLLPQGEQTVVVRAFDDPHDLAKPRGKQDWQLEPHSIWYPRTTGIWQTVWLEVVPATRIERITWTPSLLSWALNFGVWVTGSGNQDLRVELTLHCGKRLLAKDVYTVVADEVHRRVALSDPGIDDFRNELLWSPESPKLIEGEVRLLDAAGNVLDEVGTYTALRSIGIEGDRFILNGRPYTLRLVLDQGYWPDGGMTAPDDESFKQDIELTKAMGFNGVRKHQKLEDPRYLYWADRMGLLVWGEMPSAYRFTETAVERVTREWIEAIRRDYSHPCIVAWVPINESWGVPNLPDNVIERHYVEGLYHLTKTVDGTRPVVGNDGWESVATDIIGIHDYEAAAERLAHRYKADRLLPHLLKKERPGGRRLVVGEEQNADHPVVLSEFGGMAFSDDPKSWGYSSTRSASELERQYAQLLSVVRSLGMLTGFCYTQFADTYQEANGLLYADRRPKVPLDRIRTATLGPPWDR
ncbi:MAG: glycoside hydrolase family 2 TIM barrel-domain containing protein [Deltaproteobacteria bacterium]|nr:glycoside hydrolase family 2 TIM barrel-domain containing protein [Deltaproteobacteria bacterium]